jgi:protocatechuate 3,4-dioxygenase alpha subunit
VTVFARGLLHHLFTRVYFPNHTEANAADPLLSSLPEERAATLLAVPDGWFGGPGYRFDVRMQGAGETVFLDLTGDGGSA